MGPTKRYPVCLDLAGVLAADGRIADARVLEEEALEGARQSGDPETIGMSEAALAHLLALEGKFPESINEYNEGIRVLREVHDPADLGGTLLELGNAQIDQGDVAGARKSVEEVREIDRPIAFARPEIELAFARLSLASGQAEDAGTRARSALNTFTTAGREGDRLRAAALLARALMARGKTGEASGVLDQVSSPEGHALPIEAAVQFRIARYLVAAGSGHRTEADRGLDAIAAEVSRLGLAPLEKQARVAREAVRKNPNLSQAAFSH